MKLNSCIKIWQPSGPCFIDVTHAKKCWGKSFIVRNKDVYRLVNKRTHLKVEIHPFQAEKLIKDLGLIESKSFLFANASTFRLAGE